MNVGTYTRLKFIFLGFSVADEEEWRETLRRETEAEIERRVREALETPPGERVKKHRGKNGDDRTLQVRQP